MTRIGILGDLHGNDRWAVSALETLRAEGIKEVYQVGDFGIMRSFQSHFMQQVVQTCEREKIKLYVIPGNHDSWPLIEDPATDDGVIPLKQVVAQGPGWEVSFVPRGWQWEVDGKRFLSLGGAPSIDRDWRDAGIDWWPEECIRQTDLYRLSGEDGVDVMLCHDAPDGSTGKVQAIIETPYYKTPFTQKGKEYADNGRQAMNAAVDIVKPNWFIHGHYHVADYRYDSVADRHYVSMDADGRINNVGILSWGEDGLHDGQMTFEFLGGDSWI